MLEKLFSVIRMNNNKIPSVLISFLLVIFIILGLSTNVISISTNNDEMLDSNSSCTIENVEEEKINKETLDEDVSETSIIKENTVEETSKQESNIDNSLESESSKTTEEVKKPEVVKESSNEQLETIVNDEPLNNKMKGDGIENDTNNNERTSLSTVIYNDVRIKSNLTADQLKKGLYYNLKPLAQAFIDAENNYGVNAIVLASIAAEESGWGRYCFAKYNIFGFYTSKQFSSYEECIDFVAKYLSEKYLTKGACYFNGYSLSNINECYNGRQSWFNNISSIAYGIESRVY